MGLAAQAYLSLRFTVGLALAVVLARLLAAGIPLLRPLFFWAIPAGIDVGSGGLHTLAQALPLVPLALRRCSLAGVAARLAALAMALLAVGAGSARAAARSAEAPRPGARAARSLGMRSPSTACPRR